MTAVRALRARVAVTIGAIVFLVLAGTGVASAVWFVSASTSGSVSSARVSFTAVGTGLLGTEYKFPTTVTAPAGAVIRTVALNNTGQAPLTFGLAMANTGSSTLPANVSLTLWVMVGSCGTTPGTGALEGTLAAPPVVPGGAVAGGMTESLCMMTKLKTSVASSQGQSVTSTPTFSAGVGSSNWVATSVNDAAFTQSVYRIGAVTSAKCVHTDPIVIGVIEGFVTLTWAAPTIPAAGTTYKIVDTGNPAGAIYNPATSGSTIKYFQLTSSPDVVNIFAMESTYGTTSPGVSKSLSRASGLFGLLLNDVTCNAP